jgi:CelD/BcsL family acetyltransferase involved in cellulose biosynthesis
VSIDASVSVARLVESTMTGARLTLLQDDGSRDSRRRDADLDVQMRIERLPEFDELAADWRALESRADGSFFTSWSWIGALLRTWPAMDHLVLLRAVRGPGPAAPTVGLCLINRRAGTWRGALSTSALILNASGDADMDRITGEHNDILCERSQAPLIRRRLVETLLRQMPSWDELHLPGMDPAAGWTQALPARLRPFQVRAEPCFAVDLKAVTGADALERYLTLVSANTRSQVRRSIKEYAGLGALQLVEASSVPQALEYLGGLRDLHQRYWTSRGEPGAFGHPFFERFHRQLIDDAFGRGEIQMLRLQAGDTVIGYLYNFVSGGRVLNYQAGLDYAVCEKHGRPGLVAHALAVAFNAERGAQVYDFMAGANRTKESLATSQYTMDWIVLRRPRLKFWLEERLRDAKRRWMAK